MCEVCWLFVVCRVFCVALFVGCWCSLLCGVCCLLVVGRRLSLAVRCSWCVAACCLMIGICSPLFVVCWLSVVCLLFVVWYSLCVALLSVV